MSDAPTSFPLALANEAAWARLPAATKGQGAELPIWARQLAGAMPRTTASLLALEYAQRVRSPIPAKVRTSMRLVMAYINRIRTVGDAYTLDDWGALTQKGEPFTYPERISATVAEEDAQKFAEQMTKNSEGVTDGQFTNLVSYFGQRVAASIVLLTAYANFMDRLLICLSASNADEPTTSIDEVTNENILEWITPPPLVEIEFPPEAFIAQTTPPPPKPAEAPAKQNVAAASPLPGWSAQSFDFLQDRLETQRQKPTRLPIPDWETCAKNLPPGLIPRPSDIIWYRIVFGYAPELAVPFEYFMRTSGAEAAGKWDRIFATSLFWVTTKAVECPYCMGHCEMNFEVAGLTKQEIEGRSRILAGDDWSSFPPREQRAFAFARKLSLTPKKIEKPDIDQLRQDFGDETALVIILNCCRYHYMTRISNGFQLTLERENVFFDYYNVRGGK